MLTGSGITADTSYIPRITFTNPQIASAGLTETQAQERGYETKVSTLAMAHVPRALAARDTRDLIKLVADSQTDRLLGVHISSIRINLPRHLHKSDFSDLRQR